MAKKSQVTTKLPSDTKQELRSMSLAATGECFGLLAYGAAMMAMEQAIGIALVLLAIVAWVASRVCLSNLQKEYFQCASANHEGDPWLDATENHSH